MKPFKLSRIAYIEDLDADPEVKRALGPQLPENTTRIETTKQAADILRMLSDYAFGFQLSYMDSPSLGKGHIGTATLKKDKSACEIITRKNIIDPRPFSDNLGYFRIPQNVLDTQFVTITVDHAKKQAIVIFKKYKDLVV